MIIATEPGRYILDSSAILAVLFAEPEQARVSECLSEDVWACTVNLPEVIAVLTRKGLAPTLAERNLRLLPLQPAVFDYDLAVAAGMMIAMTKPLGLSFGDRACLAAGLVHRCTVLTADQAWRNLPPELGATVELIWPGAPR